MLLGLDLDGHDTATPRTMDDRSWSELELRTRGLDRRFGPHLGCRDTHERVNVPACTRADQEQDLEAEVRPQVACTHETYPTNNSVLVDRWLERLHMMMASIGKRPFQQSILIRMLCTGPVAPL